MFSDATKKKISIVTKEFFSCRKNFLHGTRSFFSFLTKKNVFQRGETLLPHEEHCFVTNGIPRKILLASEVISVVVRRVTFESSDFYF